MPSDSRATTLAFFSRLLEEGSAAHRYRSALEQIVTAERLGFSHAWLAQHHFHPAEGGLPSPFLLLSAAAQRTSRIRLGTGVVTLPLENAVRVAEDAAVLDVLSSGRAEIGLGSGGTPGSFEGFGLDFSHRGEVFGQHLAVLDALWSGEEVSAGNRLYPAPGSLHHRVWQASFGTFGATVAGQRGDGLMLSRTQPRGTDRTAALGDLQWPVVQAYLDHLAAGTAPRIMASRTVVVVEDESARADLAARTVARLRQGEGDRLAKYDTSGLGDHALLRATDTYLGTPEQVVEQLRGDRVVTEAATQLSVQVHSVPATHAETLRSLELMAHEVAPALGLHVGEARQ